jgi:tubulin polyglutamylase TTLL5
LEVNLTPALGCDSPLDQKIKANVIADLFSMAGVVAEEARMVEPLQIKKSSYAGNSAYGGKK